MYRLKSNGNKPLLFRMHTRIITLVSVEKNKLFVTEQGIFCEFRGVAQLVARHVRDVEAASSNLVTPIGQGLRHDSDGARCCIGADVRGPSTLFN